MSELYNMLQLNFAMLQVMLFGKKRFFCSKYHCKPSFDKTYRLLKNLALLL